MQVSPIASDALLMWLWDAALALTLLSSFAMVYAIARRWYLQKQSQETEKKRQEITRCFHAFLNSSFAFTKDSLPAIQPSHYHLVMRIALDLFRPLKRDELKRPIELLTLWGVVPFLHQEALEGTHGNQIQALTLLGFFEDDASYQLLMQQASNPDIYVQLAALRGLATRAPLTDISLIFQYILISDSQVKNSLLLADILAQFGDRVVPDLIKLAGNPKAHPDIRGAAIQAIGQLGATHAVPALLDLLDVPGAVGEKTIQCLAQIGDTRAAPRIARRLESNNASVRTQAAIALGKLKVMETLPALLAHANDVDWWVRFRIAESMIRFGDQGLATLRMLAQQDTEAGLVCRQVLDEMGTVA